MGIAMADTDCCNGGWVVAIADGLLQWDRLLQWQTGCCKVQVDVHKKYCNGRQAGHVKGATVHCNINWSADYREWCWCNTSRQ